MTGQSGQLMSIGTVAAQNIARALGTPEHAQLIEQEIKDEISAMSSHFTLAFADISTANEIALAKLKDEYEGMRSRKCESDLDVREERISVRSLPIALIVARASACCSACSSADRGRRDATTGSRSTPTRSGWRFPTRTPAR